MCKERFDKFFDIVYRKEWELSVIEFSNKGSDCPLIQEYIKDATQDMINSLRSTYGLEPIQ
jgi:hypothetical protein